VIGVIALPKKSGKAKGKTSLLPFVADTATNATSAESLYDAAEDSCIVIAHRANNTMLGHRMLSPVEREQVEKDIKRLAVKLGKVSKE
jgi:hypothetical protein